MVDCSLEQSEAPLPENFSCPECGEHFWLHYEYRLHIRKHHLSPPPLLIFRESQSDGLVSFQTGGETRDWGHGAGCYRFPGEFTEKSLERANGQASTLGASAAVGGGWITPQTLPYIILTYSLKMY